MLFEERLRFSGRGLFLSFLCDARDKYFPSAGRKHDRYGRRIGNNAAETDGVGDGGRGGDIDKHREAQSEYPHRNKPGVSFFQRQKQQSGDELKQYGLIMKTETVEKKAETKIIDGNGRICRGEKGKNSMAHFVDIFSLCDQKNSQNGAKNDSQGGIRFHDP
ncbi:MAG: hypothetical protein IJK89_07345 [Clostridia bacterium]|nr:hypothetical protein [Clostridia bacterium]